MTFFVEKLFVIRPLTKFSAERAWKNRTVQAYADDDIVGVTLHDSPDEEFRISLNSKEAIKLGETLVALGRLAAFEEDTPESGDVA